VRVVIEKIYFVFKYDKAEKYVII